MPKIVLGKRPTSVNIPVKFECLDGTQDVIEVEYRYRSRDEFAKFVDARAKEQADAAAKVPVTTEPTVWTLAGVYDDHDRVVAGQIVDIVIGWDLANPVDLDSALQLAREYPAAAAAIVLTYRLAMTEGRRGN